MSVLVVGDPHLNNLPRDQYRHTFFEEQLSRKARELKVETIIICGDLTDEKDYHPATLVNRVVEHIHKLAQNHKVVVYKGNHDYTSLNTPPFFKFLQRVDNVTWIDRPKVLGKWLILPHTPNPDRDWADIDTTSPALVFAHQTFEGAHGESGRVLAGVPNPFPKKTPVIAGDVHTPQKVENVTYVGAPYTIDFGDDYAPRMLLITSGNKFESIPCTGQQKCLIECRPDELAEIKAVEGDLIKLRLKVDPDEYAHWSEWLDTAANWALLNKVKLHQVVPLAEKPKKAKKAERKVVNKTDAEIIKGYVDRKGVDKGTLKIGQELL